MMFREAYLLLVLVWCYRTIRGQQTCSENGAVQLIGIKTDTFAAGRLELCVDGILRAVYDTSWGQREATLVCIQLGFSEGAISCTGSCLGASSLQQGYTDFTSCNNAARIIDCGSESSDGLFPNINAGVICTTGDSPSELAPDLPQCPTELPTDAVTSSSYTSGRITELPIEVSTLTSSTNQTPELSNDANASANQTTESQSDVHPNQTACYCSVQDSNTPASIADTDCERFVYVLIALGAVSTILLFTVMGVVIGWAWFCCKSKSVKTLWSISRLQISKNTRASSHMHRHEDTEYLESKSDEKMAKTTEISDLQPNPSYVQTAPRISLHSESTYAQIIPAGSRQPIKTCYAEHSFQPLTS